jgi:hypothetical protein
MFKLQATASHQLSKEFMKVNDKSKKTKKRSTRSSCNSDGSSIDSPCLSSGSFQKDDASSTQSVTSSTHNPSSSTTSWIGSNKHVEALAYVKRCIASEQERIAGLEKQAML